MLRPALQGLAGIALGGLCLWLALRQTNIDDIAAALSQTQLQWALTGLAVYWVNLAIRVVRWHVLLNGIHTLAMRQVGVALVVGYALNNILPARLGEFVRADFVKRQYGVPRSAALGSIFVERLTDGLMLLALLALGLLFLPAGTEISWILRAIAAIATAGVVCALTLALCIDRITALIPSRWAWLTLRADNFAEAIGVVRGRRFAAAGLLTTVIYVAEVLAVATILAALGIEADWATICALTAISSLSTLIPTAPAYVGSLQLAYIVTLQSLDVAAPAAIAAAAVFQAVLLAPVSLVGITLMVVSIGWRLRPAPQ